MKKILIGALLLTGCALPVMACTGISATAKDGGYVQARTIEWGDSYLPSQYVVIPCGHEMISYTPKGMNGAKFRARYGVVGLSIVLKDFVVQQDCFISPITEIILLMTQSRIHGQWPIYSW